MLHSDEYSCQDFKMNENAYVGRKYFDDAHLCYKPQSQVELNFGIYNRALKRRGAPVSPQGRREDITKLPRHDVKLLMNGMVEMAKRIEHAKLAAKITQNNIREFSRSSSAGSRISQLSGGGSKFSIENVQNVDDLEILTRELFNTLALRAPHHIDRAVNLLVEEGQRRRSRQNTFDNNRAFSNVLHERINPQVTRSTGTTFWLSYKSLVHHLGFGEVLRKLGYLFINGTNDNTLGKIDLIKHVRMFIQIYEQDCYGYLGYNELMLACYHHTRKFVSHFGLPPLPVSHNVIVKMLKNIKYFCNEIAREGRVLKTSIGFSGWDLTIDNTEKSRFTEFLDRISKRTSAIVEGLDQYIAFTLWLSAFDCTR